MMRHLTGFVYICSFIPVIDSAFPSPTSSTNLCFQPSPHLLPILSPHSAESTSESSLLIPSCSLLLSVPGTS